MRNLSFDVALLCVESFLSCEMDDELEDVAEFFGK